MTNISHRKHFALAGRLAVIALGLALPLAGCGAGGRLFGGGGGGSHSVGRKIGAMTFRVAWPVPSRLIPLASNAIVIEVRRDGNLVTSKTVVKPADYTNTSPPSTVTIENLEVGDSASSIPAEQVFTYTVTATAYPADPAVTPGTAQATGTKSVGLSTDDPAKTIGLTMASTIKSVVIKSPTLGTNLGPNRAMTLTAEAYDQTGGAGNLVLTTPGKWSWQLDRTTGGTLSANTGNPVDFTGKSVASQVTTLVTVTETESGLSGSTSVVTVPVGLATSVWPKFHGNNQNQGLSKSATTITATPSLVNGWSTTQAGGQVVFSSPVIATNGTIYVGAYDGKLYAISPTGTIKWTFQTGGAIEASPLISRDGTIFIGSFDNKMYALKDNGTSASQIWSYQANGPIFGSATIDKNGYLWFAAADPDNRLFCVDSLNGLPKKSAGGTPLIFTAAKGIQTAPALNLSENTVYVGDVDGNLYGVNTADATARWTYPSGSTIYSSAPMIAQVGGADVVLFGTVEGKLHAVNGTTGALAWPDAVDTEGQLYTTPALSPDGATVYVATFDNTSGLDRSRVLAYSTVDGTPVWDETLIPSFNPGFTSSPTVSKDGAVLYLGCYDGKIYGIDTTDGSVKWSLAPNPGSTEYFDSSPAVGSNGTIYIGGVTGRVYAIK